MIVPKEVESVLWSYDINKMSLADPADRFRTIINILNFGDMKAIEWLWQTFKKKEIKEAIKKSFEGEWTKPSLNLWSMIYNVKPARKSRFGETYGNPLEHS